MATVVERYNSHTRRRHDAFGFGDILVVDHKRGSLLVQACRGADTANRATKIKTERREEALRWLKAGNRIEVWGWSKKGARGRRKLWTLKRVVITKKELGDG